MSRRCVIIPAHCDTVPTDTNSRHLKNNNNAGIRKSVTDEQRLQNDRTGVDQAGSEGSEDECRESVRDDRGGDVSYRLPRCRLVKEVLICVDDFSLFLLYNSRRKRVEAQLEDLDKKMEEKKMEVSSLPLITLSSSLPA